VPRLAALASAVVAASLTACTGGGEAVKKAPPLSVAVVNGEPVTVQGFQQELIRARNEGGDGEQPLEPLRKRVLDEMIDRVLLLQQAKARAIAVGQDQVERAFLRLRAEYPGTHFDDLLALERVAPADLKNRLRDQLTVEKLFSEEVFPHVTASEEEVRSYYVSHPAEFEQKERVRVLQVVVKTKEEAAKLRTEIRKDPRKFGDVAKRSSISPEAKQGGDLGYFDKDSGMPEVFDVCFKLRKDEVSEVTPSPYGVHIFKVIDKKPAAKRTFDDVRKGIEEQLVRARRAKAQEDYLAALKAKGQIKIEEAIVAGVMP
jgi:peptidyl-prolyl cis-trans isomerase C